MKRDRLESVARTTIEAYIRDLRESMDGSKGSESADVWWTGKRSMHDRWEDFKRARLSLGLSVVGSETLFKVIWRSHTEFAFFCQVSSRVRQCGALESKWDALRERTDAEAVKQRKAIREENTQKKHVL
eukprot:1832002-Pleurochrysis_carterae.AAC.1